uniref:Uncharacterized protein n=1 Tax=Anguilla anguilla TaxID=7936 RepID=A0A0E9WTB7_ANGAN
MHCIPVNPFPPIPLPGFFLSRFLFSIYKFLMQATVVISVFKLNSMFYLYHYST